MLLPIRTSIRPRRTPYTNYALIIANVIIFFLTYSGGEHTLAPWARNFMLTPAYPFLWQFISYAFLHGSLGHIFGNMYFLYMFGNNGRCSRYRGISGPVSADSYNYRLLVLLHRNYGTSCDISDFA